MENRIFSFDLGTGSLAECVRRGQEIEHLDVLLLPNEFAKLEDVAKRRRFIRTRLAHKARENWWRRQAQEAGIEVLETRQPTKKNPHWQADLRMLKEFPKEGENVIYNSALLRIALLQGERLEGWQVFKAIWSAMQRRGYDSNLPWKTKSKKVKVKQNECENLDDLAQDKDEKENQEAVELYVQKMKEVFKKDEMFYYPCYLEAYRMGIWSPQNPKDLSGRLGTNPGVARNKEGSHNGVPSRQYVEKELKQLLTQAAKLFPKLQEKENYVLFGEAEESYASYYKQEFKKFRGKEKDWEGLLGQKIPRFDNRIISKCVLIPRLNVCKAKEFLNLDVVFLMKLKNMRYVDRNGEIKGLSLDQLQALFEQYKQKNKITEKQWKVFVKEKLKGNIYTGHLKVESASIAGRSRFCRPALSLVKKLILSGKNPSELYKEELLSCVNQDKNKGLVSQDYKFLLDMGDSWEKIYIPDTRQAEMQMSSQEKNNEINNVINSVPNSIVRHRLGLFKKRLECLAEKFGEPQTVVLELVREENNSLFGRKKKKYYSDIQNKNRKEREDARKDLGNQTGENALLKIMLLKEQNGMDFYDGQKNLVPSDLDAYEIDHIVPRSYGGPDSFINKILTKRQNNYEKINKTPFEWLGNNEERWSNFYNQVSESKSLSVAKKELLCAKEWKGLIEKYTDLAGTAYLEKLARKIVSLFFGWNDMAKGSKKRIQVVSGGVTAKFRRQYSLDRLLHSHLTDEEFRQLLRDGIIEEKNRANPRHHALDALVLSMMPEYKYRSDLGDKRDTAPTWFHQAYCKPVLEKVYPRCYRYEKAVIAETLYGKIQRNGKTLFITRTTAGTKISDFKDIEKAKKYIPDIVDENIRKDFELKLNSTPSKLDWEQFLSSYTAGNGSVPKKLSKIEKDKFEKFKEGQIKQYIKNKKEVQASIIYQTDKGKWEREPVYAFDSYYDKINNFKSKGIIFHIFRSHQLVEVRELCKNSKQTLLPGVYYLTTIKASKEVRLIPIHKSSDFKGKSIDYKFPLHILMNEGQMRPYKKVK